MPRKHRLKTDVQRPINEVKKLGGVTGKGFKPGQSGNPNGRPPLHRQLSLFARQIGYEIVKSKDGMSEMSRLELVLRKAWHDAALGDYHARNFIIERGWGKVPLQLDLNVSEQLQRKAEELGIDWQQDPALASVVAAAKLAEFRLDDHRTVGEA